MNQEELTTFYLPEKDQSFSDDRCFLCGENLSKKNTREHIFPKWLLKEFDLWDKQISLLNDTVIPYRFLTIPCCDKCNNEYLSKIEDEVFTAYKEGYETFKNINEQTLFLWISKIFYGLLFKELLLPLSRADKRKGTILNQGHLEQFRMAHLFLQGARVPIVYKERNPWSIFVFNSQVSEDKHLNFDYLDNFYAMTFGIRMGEITIIAVLQDNGTQADILYDTIKNLQKLKLHPIQFQELYAKTLYKQSTLNRTPKYTFWQNKNQISITPFHLQGMSPKNIYDHWNEEEYSYVLSHYTRVPQEELFVPPNKVMTYLYQEDGSLNSITTDISL